MPPRVISLSGACPRCGRDPHEAIEVVTAYAPAPRLVQEHCVRCGWESRRMGAMRTSAVRRLLWRLRVTRRWSPPA